MNEVSNSEVWKFDPSKDGFNPFVDTIDVTPPDYETAKKFRLLSSGDTGDYHLPVFVGISEVWAMAVTKDTPVYAVYCNGTNCLRILEKIGSNGEWKQVELEKVYNLYGLVWKICVNLDHEKYWAEKLKKEKEDGKQQA